MSDVTRYDGWLADGGPAALVIREHLMPVEGTKGVLFPATYAAGENFPGGYNIDGDPEGENVCLIDSIGSQANRVEPIFATPAYAGLVPQVVVRAGDKEVNLLEAGHRAGDAIVRCSALQQELQNAFKAVLRGDAGPLAKVAPTSLVFGVWDSRDTQAKLPRLVASTIRAFNVRKLTRSAQFVPAVDYIGGELLEETTDRTLRAAYAERGFVHVPASGSHGGVIAGGGVRRDATLALTPLRLLAVREGTGNALATDRTAALQRYILGLALTAFTHPAGGYLRQGCLLVADPDRPREFVEVYNDGRRAAAALTHEDARAFAFAAAAEFGVGPDREVPFDKELAKKDVKGEAGEPGGGGKGRGRRPRGAGEGN
jgi:CRISPR-associated protein Csb1